MPFLRVHLREWTTQEASAAGNDDFHRMPRNIRSNSGHGFHGANSSHGVHGIHGFRPRNTRNTRIDNSAEAYRSGQVRAPIGVFDERDGGEVCTIMSQHFP